MKRPAIERQRKTCVETKFNWDVTDMAKLKLTVVPPTDGIGIRLGLQVTGFMARLWDNSSRN